MTKKFLCVQGSPEIPKGATAEIHGIVYRVYIEGNFYTDFHGNKVQYDQSGRHFTLHPWQVEGNECWEEVKEEEKAGRWVPELGNGFFYVEACNAVAGSTWIDHEADKQLLAAGNVYRTNSEAEDEIKRRESIANAWHPEDGEECYIWISDEFSDDKQAYREIYENRYDADAYIGACHKTKEACEAWGKEYAHLFTKKSHD